MRRQTLSKLPEADTSGQTMEEIAHAMMVDRFGGQGAAWLIRKHRDLLHKRGEFDAVLRVDDATPPWFGYAVGFLRKREGWSVDVVTGQGLKRYRIRWHAWMQRARAAKDLVSRETGSV